MLLLNCRALLLAGSAVVTMLLAGCGVSTDSAVPNSSSIVPGVNGSVHGGQQPVAGATVRVWAPGLTGYGSQPTVLSTTTTDGSGGFKMPGYTCPANSGLLYMTVNGGNSGAGTNNLLGEAAVLGPCSAQLQASFVYVSEVTTVAAAYTLAPFASLSSTSTNIGTSAANFSGLNNTYAVANLMVPNATGFAAASPLMAGVLVPPIALPQATLNTLANILAACINSSGSTASGTTCATLTANATYNGQVPADTFQAALNIARQPAANVSNLFSLSSASAPFQPALSTAPNDLSLLVGYAGMIAYNSQVPAGPGNIAVDGSGDVYTLSSTSLVRVGPGGVLSSTTLANGCLPKALAISQGGDVFIACGSNVIQQYAANGSLLGTVQSADLTGINALAFDVAGNLWVAETNAMLEFNGASEVSGSPYVLSSTPGDVAIGPTAIWSNPGSNSLLRIDSASHALLSYAQTTTIVSVGLDHMNDVWAADDYADQFSSVYGNALELSDAGALVSPANGYPGTYSTALPKGIALDGVGNVYTANSTQHPFGNPAVVIVFNAAGGLLPNSVRPTASAGSPMTANPGKPAIDMSGNLWVPGPFGAGGYLTMVVGLGSPVVTPLATATATNLVASRP